jgi:hypothetical protein
VRKTIARKKAAAARGRKRDTHPITRRVLADRLRSGPVTSYELANVLGVYYTDLTDTYLSGLSVKTFIELARQIDMHPADLLPELESVLHLQRLPPHDGEDTTGQEHADDESDPYQDAAVILAALCAARGPLSPGALADALTWNLERVHDALDLAAADPDLAAPLGLRRHVHGSYTLTPRLDLITSKQHDHLSHIADMDAFEFTAAHTAVLLAAIGSGRTERYANWKDKYTAEHAELMELGLLLPVPGEPDHVEVDPDAVYSLNGRP